MTQKVQKFKNGKSGQKLQRRNQDRVRTKKKIDLKSVVTL